MLSCQQNHLKIIFRFKSFKKNFYFQIAFSNIFKFFGIKSFDFYEWIRFVFNIICAFITEYVFLVLLTNEIDGLKKVQRVFVIASFSFYKESLHS